MKDIIGWLVIFLFIFMFWGAPDIHDAIIDKIFTEECVK